MYNFLKRGLFGALYGYFTLPTTWNPVTVVPGGAVLPAEGGAAHALRSQPGVLTISPRPDGSKHTAANLTACLYHTWPASGGRRQTGSLQLSGYFPGSLPGQYTRPWGTGLRGVSELPADGDVVVVLVIIVQD